MSFLNHGSFGATPRAVLAAQDGFRLQMERQPLRFFVSEATPLVRAAAGALAGHLGARPQDVALIENATAGMNAVLRSVRLQAGDEILTCDHVYGAVHRTLEYVCRQQGARLRIVPVPVPVPDPEAVLQAFCAGFTAHTRLVVVDHVTSMSGLVFPVAAIAAEAQRRGIPVLIDGAHAPGMLALRLPELGATWYVGNCHKWLHAPKGAGLLWAADTAEARDDLHPAVISHFFDQPFPAEFDWIGTRDLSAWLAIPAGLAFRAERGDAAVRDHNAALVRAGAALVREAAQAEDAGPASMLGSMATLVVPGFAGADAALGERLRADLWARHRVEVACFALLGRLCVRVSAQIYNEIGDFARLAEVLPEALRALERGRS